MMSSFTTDSAVCTGPLERYLAEPVDANGLQVSVTQYSWVVIKLTP